MSFTFIVVVDEVVVTEVALECGWAMRRWAWEVQLPQGAPSRLIKAELSDGTKFAKAELMMWSTLALAERQKMPPYRPPGFRTFVVALRGQVLHPHGREHPCVPLVLAFHFKRTSYHAINPADVPDLDRDGVALASTVTAIDKR